jgi:16S rRNA (guanine527-N7)-methyltransferase|tara:strand:- start:598 stop:1224 length:627 start_codon:yes stop_codon:yes gene_type:complete
MDDLRVKEILLGNLGFTQENLNKLKIFHDELLKYNKKYNLISKSTENDIWNRHFLDSAQIVKYIEFKDAESLCDLGSGAGFPGMVLAIFNKNPEFHVKLYEKSPVKCDFLSKIVKITDTKAEIMSGSYSSHKIDASYIVSRAFKKLPEIIRISREIAKKSHKLIILKGKNAQEEINKAFQSTNFKYKLEKSITDNKSKIIISNATKSE